VVVAIVGARDRSSLKARFSTEDLKTGRIREDIREDVLRKDSEIVGEVISKIHEKYGYNMTVVSFGCDDGVGFITKRIATQKKLSFVEISIHFSGERKPKSERTKYFMARTATVIEVMDAAVLLPSNYRYSTCDDILDRLKKNNIRTPYVIFDEDGAVRESTFDMFGEVPK